MSNTSIAQCAFPFPHKCNGKWGVRFENQGTTSNKVYDQKVTVFAEDGTVIGVYRGSSTPNPYKPKDSTIKGTKAYPFVQKGTYPLTHGSHRGKPALVVNNNANVPTTELNPNFPEQGKNANYIHIHWGYSSSWKGSAGCPTIDPLQWESFLRAVPKGNGLVIIP